MKVLCVGDATVDVFLAVKENVLIQQGKKIPVDSCQFLLGGNACNVSVGLSRLGVSSFLCAEIGDDEFSQKITNNLTKEGVDTSNILQTEGAMSSFAVSIQGKNDRTLFVYHVERKHHFDLTNVATDWVYLSSLGKEWKSAYQKVLSFVHNNNVKLAFNPGTPQLTDGLDVVCEVLKKTDILFVNKEEAVKIMNHESRIMNQEIDIESLLKNLKEIGAKIVVITDGENGSNAIEENGKIYSSGVLPSHVVQKTGAGDAYTSGFLAAKIYGKNIEEAMRWGAANAAAVIEKVGAQRGLLGREEIIKRIS